MRFLSAHSNSVCALAYSPTSAFLASGDSAGKVVAWDLATDTWLAVRASHDSTLPVEALACSDHSGRATLAHAIRGQVRFRVDGREVNSPIWEGYTFHSVRHMAFLPGSARLLVAGSLSDRGAVCFWGHDSAGSRFIVRQGGNGLALTTDGADFASAASNGIYVWHSMRDFDLSATLFPYKQRLTGHRTGCASVLGFSPDGGALFSAVSGEVCRWDLSMGLLAATRPLPPVLMPLAFSPGGRLLLCANESGGVQLIETAGGSTVADYEWEIGRVRVGCFSPDGMTAVVGGADGRIVVWDIEE